MANHGKYSIAIRLLLIKEYLEANAGVDRYVRRGELEKYLKKRGYPVEKKTIYADLAVLGTMFGMQLDYNPSKKGYRLLNPPFEPYELRMLIDCVQASTFITDDEVHAITGKLMRYAGENDRASLNRSASVVNSVIRTSDSILRKVDIIHQALIHKKKISFRYFEYTGGRREHKEYYKTNVSDRFIANPRRLIWENGRYLLDFYRGKDFYSTISFYPRYYEVDCMEDICILPDPCIAKELPLFGKRPTQDYILNFLYGEPHAITIRFRNDCAKRVFNLLGEDIVTVPVGEHHFKTTFLDRCCDDLYEVVLTFGSFAKILAPEKAVKGMQNYLKEMQTMYTDDIEPETVWTQEELHEKYMDDDSYILHYGHPKPKHE